jgi:hypothetical protein
MTAKHTDPEYLANARIVRAQVRQAWRLGTEVRCWRRGCILEPGARFDVGHLDAHGGHGRENLAPECVRCNRSDGGRRGAAITNARRGEPRRPRPTVDRSRLAPW